MPRVKKRKNIYDPRVWPAWLAVGLAWIVARLPLPVIVLLGRLLGGAVYRFGRSRRHITEVNLALCFPELSDAERARLTRDTFTHTALSALEAVMVWLHPHRNLEHRFEVIGREVLEKARSRNRGVVLLGGHFSAMDVLGPAVRDLDLDAMYRENKNPVWEWLQVHGRRHYFDGLIERGDSRQTLRRLRQGRVIWYAADQDYGPRRSVFAPFFGIPAASITATAKLARHNGSPVLFAVCSRDLARSTWSITFTEVDPAYPTGDDIADATTINALIETAIRNHPEQYLWMHRRFKTRPEGSPKLY